ncbi:MAG TPA: hypothetical protein VIT20_08995, partial [Propionibacteriaceae bacterium]
MSLRPLRRRTHAAVAAVCATALLAAGCSSTEASTAPPVAPATNSGTPLVASALAVGADVRSAPFDEDRQVQAPAGWSVSVWARVESPRLMAWAPDGSVLVSRPKAGDVLVLTPGAGPAAPTQRTLLSGLNQPHGLAFADSTLYVAESDRVEAYRYAAGAVSEQRTIVEDLPDAKSADLKGAYAHALKSVTVAQDGAVYVSVGSTGNISEEDRDADPQRATILRVPAGGGAATVFSRGVRNGTGLAIDPDGAVWTAVNNRDQIAYPYDRDYDGDGRSDQGEVLP